MADPASGRRPLALAALVAACLASAASAGGGPGGLPLRLVADVPLPGGGSRFDYQSLDRGRNRLYVSHLAAGDALVFDVRRRRVVARIPDLAGVHGVIVAPELRRVYAAATGAQQLVTVDELTGAVVRRIPAGDY